MPRCVFYPRDKLDLNKHELQAYYHNEANRIDRSGEIYKKKKKNWEQTDHGSTDQFIRLKNPVNSTITA